METKKLRSGYTTGTCASAAAKAAALFLLTGIEPRKVSLTLPAGKCITISVSRCGEEREAGALQACGFQVKKDAGDDPDITHGSWICAEVLELDAQAMEYQKRQGQGYWLDSCPNLYLTGGSGVGIVTKPGLSCPVGHAAINPVPRQMILSAVEEVRRRAAYDGNLMIRIVIPEGEKLAEKTFNPRLGIHGGISVLGTTGIVKPMSEEALLATIRLEIHMRAVGGERVLLLAPGNYGETFLQEKWGIPIGKAVLCSNFIADTMHMITMEKLDAVLFVGHIGKLIKVSAGMRNTHSKYGDGRMQELALVTEQVLNDGSQNVTEQIARCNTTEEAVGILKERGLAEQVLNAVAEKVQMQLTDWLDGRIEAQVVTFSSAHRVLGQTTRAINLLNEWRQGQE